MEKAQDGVITVYLTLVFLLIISVIFTAVESARIQASRMLLETSTDVGMESLLAAYQQELYEQYGVLFFDGSYGNKNVTTTIIADHIWDNMDYNLHPDKQTYFNCADFYKMDIDQITIDKIALATDDAGSVFRMQATEYMKNRVGKALLEEWSGKYDWAVSNLSDTETYEKKERETGEALQSLEEEKSKADEEKKDEAAAAGQQTDPTAAVSELRSLGILKLIYKDTAQISQKSIVKAQMPSHRKLNKGSGLERYEDSIVNKVLFQLYLMEHFSNAMSPENQDGNLQYQIEYLLIGDSHDVDNLRGIVNRLLLIREGANFAYLLTDAAKVAEAYTAASLLVGYTCIPPLIEATKYAILLAWAYAESVMDVRVLVAGERVGIVKNAGTWKTSLSNIGQLAQMDEKKMGDPGGLSYKEYLQLMLLASDQDEIAMRALDLMELHIRSQSRNMDFKIDHMVAMIEATIDVHADSVFMIFPFMRGYVGEDSKNMRITRRFGYDTWQ